MPKIDIAAVPEVIGSGYPDPFHLPCMDRIRKRLGDAGGLTQFGVNLMTLLPGAWSSQRHWHDAEDEFVFVVSGEVVMVTDKGEELLQAGDCAAFAMGVADGHHLINKSAAPAILFEVGTRTPDDRDICQYPDSDLIWDGPKGTYTNRQGAPYPDRK